MDFPRLLRMTCGLGLMAAALAVAAPAGTETLSLSDKTSKMERLMRADDFGFKNSRSSSVWSIPFTGKHMSNIKVILAVSEEPGSDLLVVFVTVAEKRRMPVSADFMRKLLDENHQLDRVKVGFDADGDLFVREDASLRVVDEAELKNIVDQVYKSADEVYGVVAPELQ
jgi:Putative bacterial sensory transduction regulator